MDACHAARIHAASDSPQARAIFAALKLTAATESWERRLAQTLLVATALGVAPACGRRATSASSASSDEGEIESAGTWAGLRVRTVGERRHPKQVVILLHGWGAAGTDLVPLGDALRAPGRLFVFPEGPLVSPGGGRAWWHIDLQRLQIDRARGLERDLRQESPAGLPESHAQITALIQHIAARARVPLSSIVVGGFSQGAMLATDVALAASEPLGGLAVLSGSLVNENAWTSRMAAMKPGFPVFMSHGRGDPVLPFRLAEALRDHLQAVPHNVKWIPFNGGHEIPQVVLSGLTEFLAALPSASAPKN